MNSDADSNSYNEIFDKLDRWITNNDYRSFDVCDITSTTLYLSLIHIHKNNKYGKYLYFPFEQISKKAPSTLRKIANSKTKEFSQAYAVIAKAYLHAYEKSQENSLMSKAKFCLDKAISLRSDSYKHYCWGQPYDWYSKKLIPADTPRATVTSQVGSALLDYYNISQDEYYLEVAESAGDFFIGDMEIYQDKDNDICFPYTSVDNYKIHNASILAAAFLYRLAQISQKEIYFDHAVKAINFTVKHQRNDGAWHYMAPPHKVPGKIDNYHTGFILEALLEIMQAKPTEFRYKESLEKGLSFFLNNFFQDDKIPKMTPDKIYPIDIQSCAQSMITLGMAEKIVGLNTDLLLKVSEWTINNFWNNEEGYFYYRIYKNGKVDKNAYLRWSESWMLRAITYVI